MNMISEYHNYDNGYIGLVNLTVPGLPESLEVAGYSLLRKSEFHVSLICARKIAALVDKKRKEEVETGIVTTFLNFIKTSPLEEYAPQNVYRLVKRDERVSLIGMVAVIGLDKFFAELGQQFNTDLPVQPAHITLYTLQPDAGIGVLSDDQLEKDSTVVTVPIRM